MTKYYYGTNGNDVKTATKSGWGLWWENWHMYGYGGNDNLTGGHDDDFINGGSGADRMAGRKGNDTYIVDNVHDNVIEKSNEGFDTVKSYVTFTLSQNVEGLQLQGNNAINGYGNSLGNLMHGNSNRNYLYGRAGNDTMAGYGGNDRLDGGTGADSMFGGIGNDTYVVDNIRDTVIEKYNEGYDTVEALIDNYQLTNNVEALKLRSVSGVTTGRGNSLNNSITGNTSNNYLYGNGGNDLLKGHLGNDRLFGGAGADRLIGMHSTVSNEHDWLTGGGGADSFHLVNYVGSRAHTYDHSGYAILEDFSAYEQDKIFVLGNSSEYTLDNSRGDFLGGGGTDTLIMKGTNMVGVVENNTNVSLNRDFVFI